MKSRKLWISLALASALALSQVTTALAAPAVPDGGVGPKPGESEANGHTTISIMQAKVDPQNVSFTVPLYVTMAVVDNDAEVKMPSNYQIANTSTVDTAGGKTAADYKIGVTAMSFEKLSDAADSFDTVDYNAAPPNDATKLMLTIGGVDMPAVSTKNAPTAVNLKQTSTRIGHVENKFWNTGTNKPIPILANASQNLDLAGTVSVAARNEKKAVAQFRVKYTISLLNAQGDPLGNVYAGDDSTAAGLGEYPFPPTN